MRNEHLASLLNFASRDDDVAMNLCREEEMSCDNAEEDFFWSVDQFDFWQYPSQPINGVTMLMNMINDSIVSYDC